MSRAISLAARAKHSTSPNPMVGAVIVRDGRVVGEGFHRRRGGPHAEVIALRQAGEAARGATLYVTLEPCSHVGHSQPCADAVVAAGVAVVVTAQLDPYPKVAGRGVSRLRRAGVAVVVGDGEAEARALNPSYLRAHEGGRPFVALKFAATLDGKTASVSGMSRWITGDRARAAVHRLREAYDAVAVGADTVLVDDPELNVRRRGAVRQPLRVVVDGRLRTSPGARVHEPRLGGASLVLAGSVADGARVRDFSAAGVAVEMIDVASPTAADLLRALAARGVTSVLIEGGGELAWSFVRENLVDRVYAFLAPTLLGGRAAPTAAGGEGFERLADALPLQFVNHRRLGPDLLVEAIPA